MNIIGNHIIQRFILRQLPKYTCSECWSFSQKINQIDERTVANDLRQTDGINDGTALMNSVYDITPPAVVTNEFENTQVEREEDYNEENGVQKHNDDDKNATTPVNEDDDINIHNRLINNRFCVVSYQGTHNTPFSNRC